LLFFGWGMGNRVAGLPEGTFSGSIDFQNAFALEPGPRLGSLRKSACNSNFYILLIVENDSIPLKDQLLKVREDTVSCDCVYYLSRSHLLTCFSSCQKNCSFESD